MPTNDAARTDELRKAVAAGDWPTVLKLWEGYAGGIREEIERGVCTQARMEEAREFLEWARRVMLCTRAQIQTRLDAIHVAGLYGGSPARPPSTLRASL